MRRPGSASEASSASAGAARYTGSPINRGIGRPVRASRFSGPKGLVTLAVVVGALAAFGWVGLHDNADAHRAPGVGSCVRLQGDATHTDAHRVDCGDARAQFLVVAKIVGGDDRACAHVPGVESSVVVSEVDPALHTEHPAYELCLGPK